MKKYQKLLMLCAVVLSSTQSIVVGASEIIGNSSTDNTEEVDTNSTGETSESETPQSTDESSKESTSSTETSSSVEEPPSSSVEDTKYDSSTIQEDATTTEVKPEPRVKYNSSSSLTKSQNLPKVSVNVGALPVKYPGTSPYRDISGSMFKNHINWIYGRGITTGYTPTTYKPDYYVSRGEMAVFLSRLAGSPRYNPPFNVYTDVNQYKNQILWLTATTVSNGTAPHYNPNGNVTRGQMAAFLHRLAKESGKAPKNGQYSSPFKDIQNNMFKNDIGWLYSKDITTGYTPTSFKPDASITRGEMAAFLYRFYNKVSIVKPHVPVADPWKYIISHRGSAERVEHTFEAYDLAIQQGSKNIEQDVVVSKDKTLYVSHDLSAKRLTGVDKLYSDMTDAEISKLRVANGEPIHTLESVFYRYGNKVNYVVELRSEFGFSQVIPFTEMVRQKGLDNNVILESFSEDVLQNAETLVPNMPKMRLVETQAEFNQALSSPVDDIVSMTQSLMNKDNVDKVHKQNKIASAWTLDSEARIKKAISLGVDSYFTNYTGRAMQLEREYR
ncbi:S-layer homology domain-containing protein [Lactococcus formosensis]|uniref:S-layer homology domain-containing protein n=1 Tax=Lactococcus formosensis TaxID=1281486 RepID=A0A9Q8Y1D8_9LACT|nr:S-layer homology domain-containing protein [Lactococcus formosensis]USJ19925.1 S-layer homology domain-containing protein [Lactococcus formosensis]